MKGVILSLNPGARIVDITHEIPPQDIPAAAFNLLACHRDFPDGTVHVALVDLCVGSKRRPLLVECGEEFLVGRDNGIFTWFGERVREWEQRHLTNDTVYRIHVVKP